MTQDKVGESESGAELVLKQLLDRIPENKVRPRLEPTRRAVELLGDPQRSYQVIHVTGTNGKTSTTRFIERILREMGLRTGRFTSPHLVRFNERIAINGVSVSDEQILEVFEEIKPILELVDSELEAEGDTKLTFFESLAVLGFAVFADAAIDVLVLEVGMGGLWDSTNVADGDVAVFTSIGLDHMERLGGTIEEIAETKAGIIKPGAIVVSSTQLPEAEAVLREKAEGLAEKIVFAGQDFSAQKSASTERGPVVQLSGLAGEYGPFEFPLLGDHQVENLAVAVAAVEAFIGGGSVTLDSLSLGNAISDSSSPGRLQVIDSEPKLLLDAAHNPDGAEVLARALAEHFPATKLVGLVSILSDKDAAGIIRNLDGVFEPLIFTKSSSPRASTAKELSDVANLIGVRSIPIESLAEALFRAKSAAREINGVVVVTGSISLVGDVLSELEEINEK